MSFYYTKCGIKFSKSTKATTTGYKLDLKEDGSENFDDRKAGVPYPSLEKCLSCPFKVKVTDWPDKFKRWECRAGSKPPNHKNDWRGSIDDKCSLHIQSLHHDFMESVIEYCKAQPDLAASYNGTDEDDCRRSISISCSQNKAGVAAKKVLIEKFFPPEPVNLFREDGGEDYAVEPRAYDPEPMPEELRPDGYDTESNICPKNECPFHSTVDDACCFDEIDIDEEALVDIQYAVKYYACKNPAVLKIHYQKCRVCGCTNYQACKGGCSWVEDDLCSKCANKEEPKTWHPKCPYLSSMGFNHIECTLHCRIRDKKEFDSSKACDDHTKKYCFLDFDQCPTYQVIYQEEMSSTDVHILDYRKCAFCCNHTGYTGLKKGENGSKVGFCQIKQKAVDKFNSETVCEWFNRKKADMPKCEYMKEDTEMGGGCGPIEAVAWCSINHYGYCGLDTASCEEMDRLADRCGSIRVNDRYLIWKYGVPYKELDCGHCSHWIKGEYSHGECGLDSEERFGGAKACKKFIKKTFETEQDEKKGDKEVMKNDIQEEQQDMVPATGTQLQPFDYASVDADTAGFLQDKAARITEIRIKSVVAIGKELKDAQDKLANHDGGTFVKWFESLGLKKDTVYRNINAYEWVFANCENVELADNIQPSLLFAVSKPSAPKELQEKVLAGDITTHKEYQELMRQNTVFELRAKGAEDQAEQLRIKTREAEQRLNAQRDNTRQKEQEITNLKQQIAQAKANGSADKVRELGAKIKEKQEEIDGYQSTIGKMNERMGMKDKQIVELVNQLKDKPIEVPAVRVEEKEVLPDSVAILIFNRVETLLHDISALTEQEMKIYFEYNDREDKTQLLEAAKSKLRHFTMMTADVDKKQAG